MVQIVDCDSDLIRVGSDVENGSVVIFPTDTVYGLGSNPRSSAGVSKCFELKRRDFGKHLPVLFDGIESASKFVTFEDTALRIATKYWPGALTIVLPLRETALPELLIGAAKALAVRMPNHECCLKLISRCGGSLIGTSANISGQKPFTDSEDKELLEFAEGADYFVKGRCGSAGVSSTVIDLTDSKKPRIIREGAIASSEILSYFEKTRRTDLSSNIGEI
ncbi:MAG: L-threonylcarbamoyladenylate synthase [Thaumarchaeota archaeon]|nr:L-threonylcarbamoyladenylate synthase [Nitrososphaerota archaeon]MCL5067841.1 L-threonylcarbamoyladenylate synthase [Nitrososphaerota archaeon]